MQVCLVLSAVLAIGEPPLVTPDGVVLLRGTPPFEEFVRATCVPNNSYEVKVSYKAVTPVKVSIQVSRENEKKTGHTRSLLNVEKEKFTCETTSGYLIRLTAEPEGTRYPGISASEVTLHVRLDELTWGVIPGRDTLLLAGLILASIAAVAFLAAPFILKTLDARKKE
eukprot:TRINITY_DN30349_c0_g1_i1.p1 TRINITY_DN30349_c0_g1~~TRINITY_DN30349_c0_g1_i1.p1  ORF type:complete len:168 (+),score=26.41 TRINITY_DN30349_c0_g1_i1:49-552(+)